MTNMRFSILIASFLQIPIDIMSTTLTNVRPMLLAIAGLICITLPPIVSTIDFNDRPIIGILSQESPNILLPFGPTYIPTSYVKFVESAGARVVPILINQPDSYYTDMFYSLNGVLWPGGGLDDTCILNSGYGLAGKKFLHLAMQSNKKGDYFPLWGTCQGLQLMALLVSGSNILTPLAALKENLNVTLSPGFKKSKLLGNAPEEIINALTTKAITYNNHHFSVTPKNFSDDANLNTTFNILSTSATDQGKEFVSMMEAKAYPFYGVQFHPEKSPFEWELSTNIKHDFMAIKTSQYFEDFFVNEARKSTHHFSTPEEEAAALIYNFNATDISKISSMLQCYFFKP